MSRFMSASTSAATNSAAGEVARFIDQGATEDTPPTNVGGDIMVATIKDPWGNAIGLIYNPGFEVG
jgi:lactoylglutathione lyase